MAVRPTTTAPTALGFDPDALRQKYRNERDKRLRLDGNDQYVEVTGAFAHFVDDPYVAPGYSRAALTDEVEVVVIGGGFGGLLAGARLREAGIDDLRIIEKGGDLGGTWYWNRYPGAMCDVESKHIAYIVRHAIENDVRTAEVSEAAEAEWVDTIVRLAAIAQQFLEDCTPGYYNNEGKPGERSGQNGFYGGGSVEFFRILHEWRSAGGLQGLELRS
jgi:hypothetical protein